MLIKNKGRQIRSDQNSKHGSDIVPPICLENYMDKTEIKDDQNMMT